MADPMASSDAGMAHMPRKRAVGPRFDALPEFRDPVKAAGPAHSGPSAEEIVELVNSIKEPRVGPMFVKYSMWAGGAAIAYTYLTGFRAMMQKNHPAWINTFRQRVYIMTPLLAMYLTGSGLLPLPFKSKFEELAGRPAISLGDINQAEKKVKEARTSAAMAAAQKAADAFADQHVTTT